MILYSPPRCSPTLILRRNRLVRNVFQLAIATLMLAASSFAGITVSSPAPGAVSGSPITVVASANATNPIAAMRIYLDGVSAFTVNAASLDTQLTAGAGVHSLIVQAWDITGAVYKQALTVTVSSSSAPPPAIPSNATVQTQIQTRPNWGSCTVCAGIGAIGPVAIYSMQQNQLSPSLSGKSTKFNISGPA